MLGRDETEPWSDKGPALNPAEATTCSNVFDKRVSHFPRDAPLVQNTKFLYK